ncbi:CoA-binding domain-containing protein, partial [mine drainage metagenome]
GRSEAALRVALAHSGALVGSARATSAFLRAHGVIEVDDLCDMVETLEILGRQRWPKGRRIGAISESGGEAELLADHAHANGLVVEDLPRELAQGLEREFPNFVKPGNPLDAWAVDEADKVFPRSLEMLAASGAFDVLVAQVDLTQYRSNRDQSW